MLNFLRFVRSALKSFLPLVRTEWDQLVIKLIICTVLSRAEVLIYSATSRKLLGNAENRTQGHWISSEFVICYALRPPRLRSQVFVIQLKFIIATVDQNSISKKHLGYLGLDVERNRA